MTVAGREIEVSLDILHAGQEQIMAGKRRYNVAACGRRWGKTVLAKDLVCDVLLDGQPVGYFAPDYKRLIEFWDDVSNTLKPITSRSNQQERRIETIIGPSAVVEMWSLDGQSGEDAGRSRRYKRVIIDEAGLVPGLKHIWENAIRPTLLDLAGDAWFLGTPKGRNYFWQLYQRGESKEHPDWAAFRLPTSANPYIQTTEIAELIKELPERAVQQEIYAVFLEDGGGVFRNVRGVSTLQPQAERDPAHRYYAGIDWSSGGQDFTCVSVWDAVTGEQAALYRWSGLNNAVQVERVVDIWKRWHWDDCLAEDNGIGRPLIDWLRNEEKVPVRLWHTDNNSKRLVIERYAVGFEQQAFRMIENEVQIGEHEAYDSDRTPGGLVRYGAPEGFHDDTVMAGALGWELSRHTLKPREQEPELPIETIWKARPELMKFKAIQRRAKRRD